ncbi:hypothetical protein CISIN_1g046791mg [Citrus sinensis]|uniref:non-specific serine/threonine protein kinase n=1 Tax=Citrus sinensis TaxID=2711 RepID=A0A067F0Y8_CITSI|nr:hypothetical protein CISIN_1g046791mg [Citrus sinensis]
MGIKQRIDLLISFSFFVLLTGPCYSQTDTLLLGQLLKDGDELVSAFGNFRMGFFSYMSSGDRYLGIWYHRPTDPSDSHWSYGSPKINQPVWVANRNTPITDKSGSLTIDSRDGNLKILRKGGNSIVVSSVQAMGNTSAALYETGNFVLYEMNPSGSMERELWQSFDYPTDILLPGMKLGLNLQTGHEWFLRSWTSEDSPAEGEFTLNIDPNVSNQLIIQRRGEVLWTCGLFPHWRAVDLDSDFHFSYTSNEKERYFNYSLNGNFTSFPTLQIDSKGSLTVTGALPISCPGSEGCVRLSSCKGYFLDDFELNWARKRGFMSVDGFKFKGSNNMSRDDCATKCLSNCSCIAFAITNKNNNTACEIWSRGSKFIEDNNNTDARYISVWEPKGIEEKKCWLCLIIPLAVALPVGILSCSLCFLARRKYKANEKWWISLTIAISAALTFIPLLSYLCYLIYGKIKTKVERIMNQKKLLRELGENLSLPSTNGDGKRKGNDHNSMKYGLEIFDFQTISAATNNFSAVNKLGEGGFGPVYKGQLLNGQEVAIKRLSRRSGQGIVEFKNEAKLIAKLQHTNLTDSRRNNRLNWETRFSIIEGIAQGLLYLHKYSRLRVIHRDLKASNILLDDQMNPKISDFGMARIFGLNQSETNTNRVVGTYGYMSPEYAMSGVVSIKTDVFSFGVLVLEIVSGKKNNGCYRTDHPLNLIGYAWQLWNEGKVLELVDIALEGSFSPNEVLRCIHVGLLCVQDQATDRPAMPDVVSMLANESLSLPAPKQPAFFINITAEEPPVSESNAECCSINNSDKLQQGQVLRDGDQLVSAFGRFRLAFFSPRSTTKHYLGIWYDKSEDELLVWDANRDTPVLDKSGRLVKTDGTIKRVLWLSFEYPADTLLHGMKLGINPKGQVLADSRPLLSDNFSPHYFDNFNWSILSSSYYFSYSSNGKEKYFRYSALEGLQPFSSMRINPDGVFETYLGALSSAINDPVCSTGYSSVFKISPAAIMENGFIFKEDNMTLDDCKMRCL